jgi:hypothetical protein
VLETELDITYSVLLQVSVTISDTEKAVRFSNSDAESYTRDYFRIYTENPVRSFPPEPNAELPEDLWVAGWAGEFMG